MQCECSIYNIHGAIACSYWLCASVLAEKAQVRVLIICPFCYSHRPTQSVPISKLELQGSAPFQCPLLRKKVFSVCQDGVRLLRQATQKLCTDFITSDEFDGRHGYLAFRKLDSLHQFMSDDGWRSEGKQLPEGEVGEAPSFQSLESLKVCTSNFG